MLGFDLESAASLQRLETEFQDLGKIGAGGFSIVNKVKNIRDKKIYALKTLKIKPSQMKVQVSDYLQKVFSEAKILSDLNHPNILKYYGCWINADAKTQADLQFEKQAEEDQEQEQLQLVMEQYNNSSCGFEFEKRSSSTEKKKQRINKEAVFHQNLNDNIFGTNLLKFKQIRVYLLTQLGQYSLQKLVCLRNQKIRKTQREKNSILIQNYKIILDIIEGLMYLHNQKIIHRDIKLQNIIIGKNKKCKIIDFGLAKKVRTLKSLTIDKFQHEIVNSDDSEQRHSSSVGTKIFSSPEQTSSQNYDHRTDIYSLAMVIGIMFSQFRTSHQQAQLLLNLRNKKLDNFQIDQSLKTLISKCLSQQKYRPDLRELKACIKNLLRNALQKNKNEQQVEQKVKKQKEIEVMNKDKQQQ